MKSLVAILFIGIVGALAACAPVASMNKAIPTDISAMRPDREAVLTSVLRNFLQYATREDEVKVYFLKVAGEDHVDLEQFKGQPYQILRDTGSGYRWRREGEFFIAICRDKKTGQRCVALDLELKSITEDSAVARLLITTSSMGMASNTYQLKKVNGEWLVETQKSTAVS